MKTPERTLGLGSEGLQGRGRGALIRAPPCRAAPSLQEGTGQILYFATQRVVSVVHLMSVMSHEPSWKSVA